MTYQPLIYIAGHRGIVGAAIIKNLQAQGFTKLTTLTHAELELTNQEDVRKLFPLDTFLYISIKKPTTGHPYIQ